MSDPTSDDRDRDSDRDSDDERSGSFGPFGFDIGAHIGTLLDAIEERKRRRPSGRPDRASDRIGIQSDFSIGTGLGDASEDRLPPSIRRAREARSRDRKKRVQVDTDDYLTDTRWEDDVLVVTADLPGVEQDDLSVGATSDRDHLVVGVEGDVIERVPLQDLDVDEIEATYNNYVLQVRIAANDGDDESKEASIR